jgi:uncharacterized protein (DUF305 family)
MKKQIKVARAFSLALVAALAAGIFFTTAGVSVGAQDHSGHAQSADMPPGLHFIDMMMMHHREGIEMARLAEGKSQNARVKAFAAKTAAEQEKDTAQLQWHRDNRYAGKPVMDHAQMMAHMHSMPGHENMKMDMAGDMAKLRAASGREFDRLFLDTMTHHHRMAVDMSKDTVAKVEFSDIKEFARKTMLKQQAEIAEMNRIKASLGGKAVAKATPKAKPKPRKKAAPTHTGHGGHSSH